MLVELIGGPQDGEFVDVEVSTLGYIDGHGRAWTTGMPWIDEDLELEFPDRSLYRWLFGQANHLDFAGYKHD